MTMRVRSERGKTTVETDYGGSQVDHSIVHRNRGLIGAMNSFGIKETKASKDYCSVTASLEEDFDRQIKKKYGRDQGYFSPL
ncbi:MAG: hypothetical protein GTN40_05500 [Candidatus Aenigmarchaeota archaeon]|nr:hypothetical protein [Candidatus Aenigmarchaeota archaeon]